MSTAPAPGPWEFRLMHQLVSCPACKTTNRLAFQRPRAACGKCKGDMTHARPISPPIYRAQRFNPSTNDGEQLIMRLDEAAKYLSRGQFPEAARLYESTLQVIVQFLVPEVEKHHELHGEAEHNLGACYYFMQNYREAARSFKRAVPHLRFNAPVYLWLLASLEHAGTTEREINFLARCLGRDMPPSVRKSLAPRWTYQGDPNADVNLRSFLELLLQDDPALFRALQLESGLI